MHISPSQIFIIKCISFALIAIALCFLGAYLYQKFCTFVLKRKLKKRFDHARCGEKSAELLLKESGYYLEETQKGSKLSMWVNGKQFSYLVRPDAFASKDGKRYLVEIKTGKVATDPKHSATRRQLLEYYHGFDVEGVLLIDAEVEKLHHISFEKKWVQDVLAEVKPRSKWKILIAFLLGVALAILFTYLNSKVWL